MTNRSIFFLFVGTLVLSAVAWLLAQRPGMPEASHIAAEPPPQRLIPTVRREGGEVIEPSGPLSVSIQRGESSKTATLVCAMYRSERAFSRRRLVFPTIPLGDCGLRLADAVSVYAPVYPGDKLLCRVDDGDTHCTGGIAWDKAATVSVRSEMAGTLRLNGDEVGELPAVGLRLNVGAHLLEVSLADGSTHQWDLRVHPSETVDVSFPAPEARGPAAVAPAQAPSGASASLSSGVPLQD